MAIVALIFAAVLLPGDMLRRFSRESDVRQAARETAETW